MKLAVVGSGNVGGALAKGLAKAGHQVLLGSHDRAALYVVEQTRDHRRQQRRITHGGDDGPPLLRNRCVLRPGRRHVRGRSG